MLVQKQNLEMICDPSDYFIHVSEAGEDRKQLSVADTGGKNSSHFLCKACIISAHFSSMDTLCSMTLKILNPVYVAVTVLSTHVEFKTFASKSLVTSTCLLSWILSYSSISYKVSSQVATVLVIQSLSRV